MFLLTHAVRSGLATVSCTKTVPPRANDAETTKYAQPIGAPWNGNCPKRIALVERQLALLHLVEVVHRDIPRRLRHRCYCVVVAGGAGGLLLTRRHASRCRCLPVRPTTTRPQQRLRRRCRHEATCEPMGLPTQFYLVEYGCTRACVRVRTYVRACVRAGGRVLVHGWR